MGEAPASRHSFSEGRRQRPSLRGNFAQSLPSVLPSSLTEAQSFDVLLDLIAVEHLKVKERVDELQKVNQHLESELSAYRTSQFKDCPHWVAPPAAPPKPTWAEAPRTLGPRESKHGLGGLNADDFVDHDSNVMLSKFPANLERNPRRRDTSRVPIAQWTRLVKRLLVKSGIEQQGVSGSGNGAALRAAVSLYKDEMEVWPEWSEEADKPNGTRDFARPSLTKQGSLFKSVGLTTTTAMEDQSARAGDTMKERSCLQPLVLPPACGRKMCWDVLCFLCMFWDIITIPLGAFGFEPTESRFSTIVNYLVTVFWTSDILLSFLTGYAMDGITELRPSRIARRYLRQWFCVDFAIVFVDWAFIWFYEKKENALGVIRIGKTFRLIRVLRMLRLLRLIKVMTLLQSFSDYVHSETLQTLFSVAKLVAAIATVNHFIACGWYLIGTWEPSDPNWVRTLYIDAEGGGNVSLAYKYWTALHWSLTQFTPASMEVYPENSPERVYTICVILLALVIFSSFISSLTAAMTHLHALNAENVKQRDNVRRFIVENRFSLGLGNRVQCFIRQHKAIRRRVYESDIALLRYLPEGVRIQMHCEMYMPVLTCHPLFNLFRSADERGLMHVCHAAMQERALMVSEELFSYGDTCSRMYFVLSGTLAYHHTMDSDEGDRTLAVREHTAVAEIVLWTPWVHNGRLISTSVAALAEVDSVAFRKVVSRRPQSRVQCRCYAAEYLRRIYEFFGGRMKILDVWEDHGTTEDIAHMAFEGVERTPSIASAAKPKPSLGALQSVRRSLQAMQSVRQSLPAAFRL